MSSGGDLHLDGAGLILSLPEDVLALISAHLRPRDLLALSAASRRLRRALSGAAADKAWLAQCRRLLPSPPHLLAWRAAAGGSSLTVCRFLHSAAPLLGALWAHQNPELGNLVAAVPGFLSVVAARAIPQDLSPRLRWAPVFELLADAHGRPAILFLHGHQPADLFPARLASLQPHANVLFLEAQTHQGEDPIASSSSSHHHFPRLAFADRRRLLDSLVAACRVTLPPDLVAAPLFARTDEDLPLLAARREAMLRLHREAGGGMVRTPEVQGLLLLDAKKKPAPSDGGERIRLRRSLSAVAGYVRNSLRQMVTRSVSANSRAHHVDTRHLPLPDFLHTSESVGLSLRGARMRLSTYRAWPSMHDNRFALYKLTLQAPMPGREYAGLWGGTFGWPPGRPEDECKPRKALFFLLLSYEVDTEGKLLLIATKVLEGTHYVVHPNGSSMFIARMCEPSTEAFPWQTDGESRNVDVERSFAGEGIANGYGFRYPGSKPGSLFVLQDGQLAFVWRETGAVLTLQRLNLEELLKKGERVPALQPVPNFAYLTKSYSNVFTGFPGSSASPRWTTFV
ncbi:F-box protein At5g39450-like isoform X1 [Panicum virgatum]|uniref:F-box protein At5g39450-like isoform X1 n=1 Tax=Panicum virgatum TaxID=38727 RepID=UPI0019D59782|nr:F-box protein At5g39450-like isoform X1 [Panicum virgatum]